MTAPKKHDGADDGINTFPEDDDLDLEDEDEDDYDEDDADVDDGEAGACEVCGGDHATALCDDEGN